MVDPAKSGYSNKVIDLKIPEGANRRLILSEFH